MSYGFIFRERANQFRKAYFYKLEITNEKLGNILNPDGDTKGYKKRKQEFSCGVYENQKIFRQMVTDGLHITGSSLILFTNDFRAKEIDRGDKVIYEDIEYSVTDVTKLKNYANSQHLRYAPEKYKLIVLT